MFYIQRNGYTRTFPECQNLRSTRKADIETVKSELSYKKKYNPFLRLPEAIYTLLSFTCQSRMARKHLE